MLSGVSCGTKYRSGSEGAPQHLGSISSECVSSLFRIVSSLVCTHNGGACCSRSKRICSTSNTAAAPGERDSRGGEKSRGSETDRVNGPSVGEYGNMTKSEGRGKTCTLAFSVGGQAAPWSSNRCLCLVRTCRPAAHSLDARFAHGGAAVRSGPILSGRKAPHASESSLSGWLGLEGRRAPWLAGVSGGVDAGGLSIGLKQSGGVGWEGAPANPFASLSRWSAVLGLQLARDWLGC
ncbi:hypothetical protein B0H67DRAFT_126403 [Lasiosphaeris hirsuta]|uniref:Uncharacterized protein n=1 Tax=Lasiosphaeris hirsuta TaxID=260670 RepID=A0AA40E606_9PEZI|nr:hypothetical protein B0H67DRAFT_126403 [Lasiosphaeris hirsuta]